MKEADIENALKARLAASSITVPFAWPNQDAPGSKPYIAVQPVRASRRGTVLDGSEVISRGQLLLTVVTEPGTSTRAANEIADDLAALFPMALRIDVTGGHEITVLQPPDIREGFRDGDNWRAPVVVDYEAI